MRVTLKQIDTFVRLAALCSFRRVAEQMNTTQPNISNRISQLESVLGMRLFERDAGAVTLTEQGRHMLPLAERVLSTVGAFEDAGKERQIRTTLRLGAAEMVARSWLQDYLSALHDTFPHTVVELTVDRTINLQRALLQRTIDLALLNGPVPDFNIANLELGQVDVILCASPQIAALLPNQPEAEDLAPYPIITHARDTRAHVEAVQFFREADCLETRIVPSNDMLSCIHMAINGLGLALLAGPFLQPAIDAGQLVKLQTSWHPTGLNFTASYPHSPASHLITTAASMAKSMTNWAAKPPAIGVMA